MECYIAFFYITMIYSDLLPTQTLKNVRLCVRYEKPNPSSTTNFKLFLDSVKRSGLLSLCKNAVLSSPVFNDDQ
jgi:hypothetical protein